MSILNNFITVVNPDGTISYFPNTLQSEPGIPFRSVVDMAEDINYFSPTNTSPNIVDEARDLNEAVKRRTLFSTNFQDPYYLDSILNQNAANKAAMDVFKQGFRNKNMMNQGIMNQAPSMFLDDAGLPAIDTSFGVANEPDVKEDADEARKRSSGGIANLFRALLGFAVPGANLILGGLEGIKSLNQRIRNTDFGRSSTLSEFLQRRRDRKAREEAARRGAEKQRIQKLREFNQGAAQYFGGGDDRPGGFGQGAGSFRESEPTATEGSF